MGYGEAARLEISPFFIKNNESMTNHKAIEAALIGTALLLQEHIPTLLEIPDDDFEFSNHKRIVSDIRAAHDAGRSVDVNTISGASAFLKEFTSDPKGYADIIQDRASVRRIITECQKVIEMSHTGIGSESLISELAKISSVSSKPSEISSISDHMLDIVSEIDDIRNGRKKLGLRTGLDFEKGISGFEKGKMYIIAARPAMGKSAFALEIASRIAAQDVPVGILSLEMSTPSLITRMLIRDSGIEGMQIREGIITEDQMSAIVDSAGRLSNYPIYFSDNSYVTSSSLRAKAISMISRHNVGMIIVDYLQLMTGDGKNREQDVSEASRVCKLIARELDIPVVVLAQLNRAVEMRENKRPMMSDLRESGAIEQNADAVMMLYRPEYYEKHVYGSGDPESWQGQDTENICEVVIAKNRDGATGIIRQVFFGGKMRFENRAKDPTPPTAEQIASAIPQGSEGDRWYDDMP